MKLITHGLTLPQLLINTEACVNTLQYECTQFYLDHRRDGRNYSARDRYPCYYTPRHGDFVTTRFSVEDTRYVFLMVRKEALTECHSLASLL